MLRAYLFLIYDTHTHMLMLVFTYSELDNVNNLIPRSWVLVAKSSTCWMVKFTVVMWLKSWIRFSIFKFYRYWTWYYSVMIYLSLFLITKSSRYHLKALEKSLWRLYFTGEKSLTVISWKSSNSFTSWLNSPHWETNWFDSNLKLFQLLF